MEVQSSQCLALLPPTKPSLTHMLGLGRSFPDTWAQSCSTVPVTFQTQDEQIAPPGQTVPATS